MGCMKAEKILSVIAMRPQNAWISFVNIYK